MTLSSRAKRRRALKALIEQRLEGVSAEVAKSARICRKSLQWQRERLVAKLEDALEVQLEKQPSGAELVMAQR